jgi:hypothetical protein
MGKIVPCIDPLISAVNVKAISLRGLCDSEH